VLHITSGDSAAQGIRDAGIPGNVLPRRDLLHEGPVPQGITLDQLRVTRARFMEGLIQGKEPLVLQANGEVIAAPRGRTVARDFWDTEVRLTPVGREVLQGNKDRAKVNGIDRWLGGVHLSGPDARWRWDQAAQRVRDIAA
jgi:hypothetical protein